MVICIVDVCTLMDNRIYYSVLKIDSKQIDTTIKYFFVFPVNMNIFHSNNIMCCCVYFNKYPPPIESTARFNKWPPPIESKLLFNKFPPPIWSKLRFNKFPPPIWSKLLSWTRSIPRTTLFCPILRIGSSDSSGVLFSNTPSLLLLPSGLLGLSKIPPPSRSTCFIDRRATFPKYGWTFRRPISSMRFWYPNNASQLLGP